MRRERLSDPRWLREGEKIIAAFAENDLGYVLVATTHEFWNYNFQSINLYIPEKFNMGTIEWHRHTGYITSHGRLTDANFGMEYCIEKGLINRRTMDTMTIASNKIYRLLNEIGEEYDIPKARELCHQHNLKREQELKERDGVIKKIQSKIR